MSILDTRGVYEIRVAPSVRNPELKGNYYLIYNTVTDVVEEEVTYAPQAYSYLEQLSAEWDARVQSAELEELEKDGDVAAVASLREDYNH